MNRLGNQIIKTISLVGCGVFSYLLYDEEKTLRNKRREAKGNPDNFSYSEDEYKRRDSSIDAKAMGFLVSMGGLAIGNMLLKNNDDLDTRNTRLEKVSEALLRSNFDLEQPRKHYDYAPPKDKTKNKENSNNKTNSKSKPKEEKKEKNE